MNRQSYVKAVAKNLACSKALRDEFVRDLESDIDAALEGGEGWEQVERRLGDPRLLAREFNGDLPEAELAAGKRRKRNKVVGVVAAAVIVLAAALAGATWWMTPSVAPAGQAIGVSEREVVARAQEAIGFMNDGDYDALRGMLPESLRSGLTDEALDQARDTVGGGNWGAFESFRNTYANEVSQAGHSTEVVEIVAVYENAVVTYDITFNERMEMTNFFVK